MLCAGPRPAAATPFFYARRSERGALRYFLSETSQRAIAKKIMASVVNMGSRSMGSDGTHLHPAYCSASRRWNSVVVSEPHLWQTVPFLMPPSDFLSHLESLDSEYWIPSLMAHMPMLNFARLCTTVATRYDTTEVFTPDTRYNSLTTVQLDDVSATALAGLSDAHISSLVPVYSEYAQLRQIVLCFGTIHCPSSRPLNSIAQTDFRNLLSPRSRN